MSDEYEIEDCSVLHETDKAILVKTPDEELWVPKSQLSDDSEVYKEGTEGSLIVKAKKQGWL